MATTQQQLQQLLQPLLTALTGGPYVRLVARPGWVMASATQPLDVAWDVESHTHVLTALQEMPAFSGAAAACGDLFDGVSVAWVDETLVLTRALDPVPRVDDLVQSGCISSLAARTLSAAVGLGRNILVAGPWVASVPLIGALVGEGARPAVMSASKHASQQTTGSRRGAARGAPGARQGFGLSSAAVAPSSWPRLQEVEQVHLYGADRIALWSADPAVLPAVMGRCSGVVAWLEARRLDQAMVRYEAAIEAKRPGRNLPLGVLAGVDMVVVIGAGDTLKVREVAEVDLAEEGYRLSMVFESGHPPAPSALVPVGLPSFVEELRRIGQHVLAEELVSANAVGIAGAMGTVGAATATATATATASNFTPHNPPTAEYQHIVPHPTASTAAAPSTADAPPPGWELDQMPDDPATDVSYAEGPLSEDEAALAATYGLAPPPRRGHS